MDDIASYLLSFEQKEQLIYCLLNAYKTGREDALEDVRRASNGSSATYADMVYNIVMSHIKCTDTISEDYILKLVGTAGLDALKKHRLLIHLYSATEE